MHFKKGFGPVITSFITLVEKGFMSVQKTFHDDKDMTNTTDKLTVWFKLSKREGWQGCSSGFPSGLALGNSLRAALPALGKPRPSQLFYSDLHSISNTVF